MAIDDWQRGNRLRRLRIGLAVATLLAVAAAGLAAASPSIAYLRASIPHYDPWLIASVAEAAAVTLIVAGLLATRPAAARGALLAVLLLWDGIALFSVPRLADLRDATLDTAAVTWLRQHLGLQRFYTWGPFAPNYAAFFQVASLNSDYLPQPSIWSDHIRKVLDANTNAVSFSGTDQFPGHARPDHISAFRDALPAYQALGVRYVLLRAGERLAPAVDTGFAGKPAEAAVLAPGASLETVLPAAALRPGAIETIAVAIGTYGGVSDGALEVTACAGEMCQSGAHALTRDFVDNTPLELDLDAPLPIEAGQDLRLRFSHVGGMTPVVIWQFPAAAGGARSPGLRSPGLVIGYAVPGRRRGASMRTGS